MVFALPGFDTIHCIGGSVVKNLCGGCVCNFSVLSCHNKNLKRRTDQCYSSVLQLSFIWKVKENTSSRHDGGPTQKMRRGEKPPHLQLNFGPSFICFFLLSLSLPYVNWTSQEGCLFYLRLSLLSWDLPLFYFHGLFPSLFFSHCHSGLLFPVLTT